MKHGEYVSLYQAGRVRDIMKAMNNHFKTGITYGELRREIMARRKTPPPPRPRKEPKYFIDKKFFVKLYLMPSVELYVRDSVSKIRRECYGFRDPESRERVYLKIDGDSVIVFRDSPAGFITGKRYFIPRLEKMRYPKTFPKVNRLMTRMLRKQGIIVDSRLVKEYTKQHNKKYKLANILVARYQYYFDSFLYGKHTYTRKGSLNAKTWK